MEINSNTRNSKIKRQLNIFITANEDIDSLLINEINGSNFLKTTKSLGDADLILNIRNNKFFFSGLTSALNFQIPSLLITKNNIQTSFKLLYNYLNPTNYNRDKQRKSLKKKYNKTNAESRKVAGNLKIETNSEYTALSQKQDDVIKIYEKLSTISELPQTILSISSFRKYEACQIIIHEKGKQTAVSNSFSKLSGLSNNIIPVNQYNSLFNNIKKSKHKLFQAEQLGNDTAFLGTFLGSSFGIGGHSIIFMMSRNDFLPPNLSEQQNFNGFCNFLSPILQRLLTTEQITDKNQKLLMAISNLNRPLIITNRNDEVTYSNKAFDQHRNDYLSNLHKQFIQVALPRRQKAYVHKYDSNSITTDLLHFKKITLLGELLNTLQHELSNPLFGIKLSGELLQADSKDDEITEIINEITNYAVRCQTIIENFSYLYRDEQKEHKIDLKKLINETIILTKSETRNIRKIISLPREDISIISNPTWISQIIFNLVINASQAIKEKIPDLAKEFISISLTVNQKAAIIEIADSGPGISVEMEDQIFTPFFTTKNKGTGLGLSICRNLALKMNSTLHFKNNTNCNGACFILELPLISN